MITFRFENLDFTYNDRIIKIKDALTVGAMAFCSISCQESDDPIRPAIQNIWEISGYERVWSVTPEIIPIQDSAYTYQFEEDGAFIKKIGEVELRGEVLTSWIRS